MKIEFISYHSLERKFLYAGYKYLSMFLILEKTISWIPYVTYKKDEDFSLVNDVFLSKD